MSEPDAMKFSEYIVFVDESGDHGLENINREFPLFALAFCPVAKAEYIERITPAVRRLKMDTFGHDLVVLHEHDIRKTRRRLRPDEPAAAR